MNNKFFYVLSMCFLASASINAQVTMGSGFTPNKGTLLDLKEYNDPIAQGGGRNSDRGVILPRVKLTIKNALTDITGASGTGYEGLMVYNVNDEGGLCPGLHVWDGNNWVALQAGGATGGSSETLNNAAGTGTLTDHEGNKYPVAKFGNRWWTTQNIRTKSIPSKCAAGEVLTTPINGGVAEQEMKNSLYHYPQTTQAGNIFDDPQTSARPEWGLLYNWAAATNKRGGISGKNCFDNEGGTLPSPIVQGICPTGWHLPSDKEWTDLEIELINSNALYSNYTGTPTPPGNMPQYDNTVFNDKLRGHYALGNVIKLPTSLDPTIPGGTITVASSNLASNRGFAALLTGAADMNQGAYNFGSTAQFITSSNYDNGDGGVCNRFWTRYVGKAGDGVTRDKAYRYAFFSVRCIKDL